ncbi:HAD family hydrolase [Bacillus massiliigorillae]|uniref:HAD family hydrolase n=1 Tax=Bacillus massiliigorillae TaxID=1243664 RepID=UPI00039987B2|nr:HAD family hydrolase [Bacillus massiliigorillae]
MFTTIIFDVDGTIIDTEEAILKSLQRTLKEELNMEYAKEELTFALGIPGKETLKRLNVVEIDRILSIWSQAMLAFVDDVKVFEQMEEVIKQLVSKQTKLGIVTSKTNQEMTDEFEQYGLHDHFAEIITASHTEKHKPHPEPLLACMEKLDVQRDHVIYIGDSIYDLQCAKGAGVKFALALWGSKTETGFEEADYVLREPKDILKLIQ